jgi:hypothetical protein
MAENNIMSMVGAFIGIAVILGIGIQILGNSVQDCSSLPDFNGTVPSVNQTGVTLDNQQTGWAAQCISNNAQSQNAYTLLVIILIVVAAVAILSVVRMLG